MKADAAAIIVAGGQGKRFGGKVRKQYLVLTGHPILWWAVHAFHRSPSIAVMVLVVPQDDLAHIQKQFSRAKMTKALHIVAGGKERADSVRKGLAAIPSGIRWVAVHDGVRPLVTPELIENVLQAARAHKAAIAASPSKDTVKLAGRNHMILRTLPRETVWLAQTPQAFDREVLERAHRKGQDLHATDDAFLVERLGIRVKLVQSPPENLKVTVPADLVIARAVIARRSTR